MVPYLVKISEPLSGFGDACDHTHSLVRSSSVCIILEHHEIIIILCRLASIHFLQENPVFKTMTDNALSNQVKSRIRKVKNVGGNTTA